MVTPAMKPTFEVVLRSARGFLEAARLLETAHRHEAPNLPVALDDAWLCRSLGILTSATVLEALAVEQALKALLIRAQIAPPKTHDHRRLFDLLPQRIRQQAENEYSRRHPMMRQTLPEALDFSAKVFEQWRYAYDQPSNEASGGEMFRAFAALTAGL